MLFEFFVLQTQKIIMGINLPETELIKLLSIWNFLLFVVKTLQSVEHDKGLVFESAGGYVWLISFVEPVNT